jgi:integrase
MARPRKHYGKWVDEHRRRQSETFDTFDEAVFAQQKHELEVKEIKRGLRSPIPPNKTVGDLCDYWVERRAPQKRSRKDDESVIRCHIRPLLADVRLLDVTVAHSDLLVAKRAHLDRKTVHNILTLLISMLNMAVDLGWLIKAPRIRKPRIPIFHKDFHYLRTKAGIARFLRAAREEGEMAFACYSTAIYTGLRAGELAGLRWDDVDLEARRITVQRSYDGPTKAGDLRYVPILDPLLPVLRAWRLRCPGLLVFPTQRGTMQCHSARVFQEVFHRVLDAANFEMVECNGKRLRYIRFHDLRHYPDCRIIPRQRW